MGSIPCEGTYLGWRKDLRKHYPCYTKGSRRNTLTLFLFVSPAPTWFNLKEQSQSNQKQWYFLNAIIEIEVLGNTSSNTLLFFCQLPSVPHGCWLPFLPQLPLPSPPLVILFLSLLAHSSPRPVWQTLEGWETYLVAHLRIQLIIEFSWLSPEETKPRSWDILTSLSKFVQIGTAKTW